jgi:hypothetical protein
MSKAEHFIEENTRNCSNELIAIESRAGKEVISYYKWLTPDQARKAVEIEREEIIEKACEFMCKNIDKQLTIYHNNTWRKRDEFIEDIKQAMKDE